MGSAASCCKCVACAGTRKLRHSRLHGESAAVRKEATQADGSHFLPTCRFFADNSFLFLSNRKFAELPRESEPWDDGLLEMDSDCFYGSPNEACRTFAATFALIASQRIPALIISLSGSFIMFNEKADVEILEIMHLLFVPLEHK